MAQTECWDVVRLLGVSQAAQSVAQAAGLCIAVFWIGLLQRDRKIPTSPPGPQSPTPTTRRL